jgi:hypothetical protein
LLQLLALLAAIERIPDDFSAMVRKLVSRGAAGGGNRSRLRGSKAASFPADDSHTAVLIPR